MIYGLLTITIIYAWLYYAPSLGVFSGLFEFLFAGGTSILAGITLLVVIPRSRKLFSLLLIILSPVIMYLCLDSGFYFSPSSKIERNGIEVAYALESYSADKEYYPDNLEILVPDYIDDLKSPNTHWGWLYKLEGEDYALGYFYNADKYSYSIRIYRPATPEWKTMIINLDHTIDPFSLGPTPTPTPRNSLK